ncbi:MAG: hypothetical protein P8R54_21520 [Myxococcota bacterium]|nr:hypothetical protein [Myxococcota bacterium]
MPTLILALFLIQTVRAGEDVSHHLNQAALFIRRGWFEDAAAELAQALESPAGQTIEVYELAGQVAWERLDIEGAIAMAEGAAAVAPSPAQAQAATRLADSYRQQFGFLTIEAPYPGMTASLQLESTGLILSAELKDFISRAALHLQGRTALPLRVGLPIGSYRVNGQEVTVAARTEAVVTLPMSAIGSRGRTALQLTRLEIDAGGMMLLGEAAEALIPAPVLQVSLTQPLGPVVLGGLVQLSPISYLDAQNRIVSGGSAWSVGGRIGRELALAESVRIRPSIFARYGAIPGLSGSSGMLTASASAIAAGGELCAEYREPGQGTLLGSGVKLSADRTWGRLSDDEDYSAVGLSMLATLSAVF